MFTNWLTPTITSNAPPPDVILEIGPPPCSRFAAHSALLAAHSGYLRSAIRPDDRHMESAIFLPNLSSEQFAPLLTYMYTGFLDLNMENIFGVLLATHILHMPRALEICRAFLTRTQPDGYFGGAFFANSAIDKGTALPLTDNGVKIVRPIASKATGLGFGFVAPPQSNRLLPSHDTPFKSLHLTPPIASPTLQPPLEEKSDQSPIPSTSKSPPTTKDSSVGAKKSCRLNKRAHSDKLKAKVARSVIVEVEKVAEPSVADEKSKIIIDVASCDGPVRFQRVLNEAYGRVPIVNRNATSTRTTERSHENVANSFHIQMARTINERKNVSLTESDNSQDIVVHEQVEEVPAMTTSSSSTTTNKSEELYTCVYCKHTFKSQYCYQKHAKRHINPLAIDNELVVETNSSGSEKEKCTKNNKVAKREVRPLDMNVQYYPCKTCGSRFPSYYFVHKHRKMCHANDES